MVQTGANVTLEECENTLHQVVEKAQQLFAYLVGDETVPNKTEVCNFCFKTDANKTAIRVISVASSEHSCSARARERCKERRSRAAKEDDCERKTLWSTGSVSRTPVSNPVLSLCRRVHNHAQCTLLVDS